MVVFWEFVREQTTFFSFCGKKLLVRSTTAPAASETSGTSGHFAAASVSVTGPAASPAAAVSTATAATHASAHTTPHTHHAAVGFDGNFLDLHFLSIDNNSTLFEQSICWFLLVEGNEAKVLGFAIFAAINWPLDFHNLTVLAKMLPNDIF